MRFLYLVCLPAIFAFDGCVSGSGSADRQDSVKNDSDVPPNPRKTYYDTVIRTDFLGLIHMELYHDGRLLDQQIFGQPAHDTTYYTDGCVESVTDRPSAPSDYEETYKHYYHKHILKSEGKVYFFDGLGGSKRKVNDYDSTAGKMTSTWENNDYLPAGGRSGLDNCSIITTTTYFPNGKPDSITSVDYKYEGVSYCPCGTWEYYDSTGKLLHIKKFKKCGDGETDCVQDTVSH